MEEVPGSVRFFPAQLVFLALGFLGPQNEALKALGVKQDGRSNIQTPPKVSTGRGYSGTQTTNHINCLSRNILLAWMAYLRQVIVVVVSH